MKVGDTLCFRVLACRYPVPRGIIKRKIVGFDSLGQPMVRFAGYSDFVVRREEIVGGDQ